MATLTITVNYSAPTFSYALSYTDTSGTAWAGSAVDSGTVTFINSGQYTLKAGDGTSATFTFDTVNVVLGPALATLPSNICTTGTPVSFDLTSIVFPRLPDDKKPVSQPYQWCQAIPAALGTDAPQFKDPKLGLSNTSGTTPIFVSVPWPTCNCAAGSRGS
jgi:hypothetical protein